MFYDFSYCPKMDNCPFSDSLFRFFIPNPPPFTLFPLPEKPRLFFSPLPFT